MTREDARILLEILRDWVLSSDDEDATDEIDALGVAIKALKQPEQKKGKWICHDAKEGFLIKKYTCSICNYYGGTQKPNFCANCGAKMEGEENENKS